MKPHSAITALFLAIALPAIADDCGTERWAVKVGADADAVHVNLQKPTHATIEELTAMHRPAHVGNRMPRVSSVEDRAFVVDAVIVMYRSESDGDVHIVLRDASGRTMIAEIPSSDCMPESSPFRVGAARARAAFLARFPRRKEAGISVPVRITGPAFFDFRHRQLGIASNAIEIHPVTRIEFPN